MANPVEQQQNSNAAPSASHRIQRDVTKLMTSDHETTIMENILHLHVKLNGPVNTPYEGGVWTLNVVMPKEYPYKAPIVRFSNKIFHPNVEFVSGAVCMNVFKQAWSPLYDLLNIFDTFLPQLLRNPNPNDPLNQTAATLLHESPRKYFDKVVEFVKLHATPIPYTPVAKLNDADFEENSSDISLSDLDDD